MRFVTSIIILFVAFTVSTFADEITITTEDGFKLSGTLLKPSQPNGAGIVLIHQGGSDRTEWTFMHDRLLGAGYTLISYDVRGMGASPKTSETGKGIENIYNAPNQATLDLKAATLHLKAVSGIDRIGILGASIGGNLAVVGASTMDIKASVAISGKTEAVQNLAGIKDIKPQGVYYISSMESNGARAEWAQEMFNMTASPREIAVTAEEQGHGVTILHDNPVLQDTIVEWFMKYL